MAFITIDQQAHLDVDRLASERRMLRVRLVQLRNDVRSIGTEMDRLLTELDSGAGVRA